jgi:hypothetical protein
LVSLETTFVHPAAIDRSFDRLVRALSSALAGWADQPDQNTAMNRAVATSTKPATPSPDMTVTRRRHR